MTQGKRRQRVDAIAATKEATYRVNWLAAKLECINTLMGVGTSEGAAMIAAVSDLRAAVRAAHDVLLDAQEAIDLALDSEDGDRTVAVERSGTSAAASFVGGPFASSEYGARHP
jgi:hypothetical protein